KAMMKKIAVVSMIVSSLSVGMPAMSQVPDDPDLPPGLTGQVDKEEFLRARSDYFDLIRGLPSFLPYDARVRALEEMNAQEAAIHRIDPSFWTQLGPNPIPNGQTVAPSTPVSGRTVAIAVHPSNPNIV